MRETRTEIIECAFRLFLEKGFEATSIADLVAASGLSKGALYHHFRDKAALQDATIQHFFLRYFEPVPDRASPASDTESLGEVVDELVAGFERLIAGVAAVVPDFGTYYRFIFSILPKVRAAMTAQIAASTQRLVAAIERDQAGGALRRDLSPTAVARQILALIEGTAVLAVVEGRAEIGPVLRQATGEYLGLLH